MSHPAEALGFRADTRRLLGAGTLVSAFGLASKALGQLRESAVAALFGATRAMDAFNIAKTVPDMFSSWIEAPVRSAVVPLFTKLRAEKGEAEAWRAASNIVNTLGVGLLAVTGAVWLGADLLVRLLSTGFRDAAAWSESAALARILVPSLVFAVLTEILGALSNIHGRQAVPAIGRLLHVAVVLVGVVALGPVLGLRGYAWAMLAGTVAYFVLQTDIVWRHRRHWRWEVRPRAPEIRQVVLLGGPLFIGLIGPRIDVVFDQNFASFLPQGSLTILNLSRTFASAATDIVLTVSHAVLLPHFALLIAERRLGELRARLDQVLSGYLFLSLPMLVFFACAAQPVIDLFYRHGRFTPADAAVGALVLPLLALADPAFGWGQVLAQVHISRGDTVTPMKVGFWRIGFKIALSAVLIGPFGIYGLAAATSASTYLRTWQLWRRLPAELRPDGGLFLARLRSLALPLAAAAGAVLGADRLVPASDALALSAARVALLAGLAAMAYGGTAFALGDPVARGLVRRLH